MTHKLSRKLYDKGCSVEDLLLEMDRILRPTGFVIIRDKSSMIKYISNYLPVLKWDSWKLIIKRESDVISSDDETILFAQSNCGFQKKVSYSRKFH